MLFVGSSNTRTHKIKKIWIWLEVGPKQNQSDGVIWWDAWWENNYHGLSRKLVLMLHSVWFFIKTTVKTLKAVSISLLTLRFRDFFQVWKTRLKRSFSCMGPSDLSLPTPAYVLHLCLPEGGSHSPPPKKTLSLPFFVACPFHATTMCIATGGALAGGRDEKYAVPRRKRRHIRWHRGRWGSAS